jgi:hypothetical protein
MSWAAARRGAALAIAAGLALYSIAQVTAEGSAQGRIVRRAILESGADAVKGLPFFSPNAIPTLTGAYELEQASQNASSGLAPNAPTLRLWYTRETVVLGSDWKSFELGEGRAYILSVGGKEVLALRADRYTLFFEPDTATGAARLGDEKTKAFIRAFSRKFLSFFENAASEAELSFPAYVDY